MKAMQKISGRSWCVLGFSNPLCGQELCSPQLRAWVGQDRPLTTESGNPCTLMTHGYRVRVSTTGPSWIPSGTLTLEHTNCAHLSHLPVPCPSTAVAPDTYTGQGSVEAGSLALACHNIVASTTCEMTPPGHSQSTQPVDCDAAHMLITSAIADMTHDLDRDCHYTRLHTQARDGNRVLVEPRRDGTQRCL